MTAVLGRVVQRERRMDLGLDVGRYEPALEQSLGLVRMVLGTFIHAGVGRNSCHWYLLPALRLALGLPQRLGDSPDHNAGIARCSLRLQIAVVGEHSRTLAHSNVLHLSLRL